MLFPASTGTPCESLRAYVAAAACLALEFVDSSAFYFDYAGAGAEAGGWEQGQELRGHLATCSANSSRFFNFVDCLPRYSLFVVMMKTRTGRRSKSEREREKERERERK